MPYITKDARDRVLETTFNPMSFPDVQSAGELNYAITALIDEYIAAHGGLNYDKVNAVVGVLECVKLEMYRRVAAPYEDRKRAENGEVYTCLD